MALLKKCQGRLSILTVGDKLSIVIVLVVMSEDQLKAFLAALQADTGLQAKLKAAVEGELDTGDETAAVLAIAKEAGFTITAAELIRNEAQNILELSDEELESVSGGTASRGMFCPNTIVGVACGDRPGRPRGVGFVAPSRPSTLRPSQQASFRC